MWRALNLLTVVLSLLLGGCVVPQHMNVTDGLRPDNLDKEVRFRTTYYFRAFDCRWKAAGELGQVPYRYVIPESDTVYRFRMTGKASGLANRIRFESDTLNRDDIEPFGKTIRYADAMGSLHSATAEQVATQLAQERAGSPPAASSEASDKIDTVASTTAAVWKDVAADAGAAERADTVAALNRVEAAFKDMRTRLPADAADTVAVLPGCGVGDFRHRGFEIMGPEGIRKFDQNERLIMAMHSSAEPLIGTLQEYSAHLLNGQTSVADRLLPLTQAAVRLGDARRAVLDTAPGNAGSAAAVFAAALPALGAKDDGK